MKTVLLGSLTGVGLLTGYAAAADLGVLDAVDTCDALGISGLTLSSGTNCLRVSGEVDFTFSSGLWHHVHSYEGGNLAFLVPGGQIAWGYDIGIERVETDSAVTAKLNVVATADSAFGPTSATLKLLADDIGSGGGPVGIDEAYVAIGDGTVLMAGHKGSVFNSGDDEPLNWLGLFNSQAIDAGVKAESLTGTSNAVQITADLGNGFSLAGGLENLDDDGTAVGAIAYKSDSVSGHLSIAAGSILGGSAGDWTLHAGLAATFDKLKVVAALATDDEGDWNLLASAASSWDLFTLSGSVEAQAHDYTGAGVSLSADVADGVKLNIGSRWADYGGDLSIEVAAGGESTLAADLTLSGAVGYVDEKGGQDTAFTYAWAKLAWAPGGGYTASLKGTSTYTISHLGHTHLPIEGPGYKIEAEVKKTFE